MKTTKMMKTINRLIKECKTDLTATDVKKYFGKLDDQLAEQFRGLGFDVQFEEGVFNVKLDHGFDREEIAHEELMESFDNF